MAMKVAAPSLTRALAVRPVAPVSVRRSARSSAIRCQAQKSETDAGFEFGKAVALTSVASTWLMSGNAQAATEIAQMAASDNRIGIIATLFVPVLGWVGFNMLQPALNQLNKMSDKLGVAGAVGLGAALSMMLADSASAATEVSQLAASDNRIGIIATLFVPVLGWVGFNMLQPAMNQVNKMNEKLGVAGAVGMASLLLAENADAATEVSQLAASDNRIGIIATLFVPVVGWVLFNIFQPALNQLDKMNDKRGVAGAIGLGSLLLAQNADAATEISQLAASDNRIGIIATLFVPVLGWVGFNMLQPALNQVNKMNEKL